MSFERQKRLLLGLLAFVVPLPLPFNGVLEWPVLLLYWAVLAYFFHRVALDPEQWLPVWATNLLAIGYLPLLYLDLSVLMHGQILRPLVHLALFALLVKLFSLRREREKWHALTAIFFLFLAAMGTSVHPSISLYLVACLTLAMLVLARFASFHFLVNFGSPRATAGGAAEATRAIPLRVFLILGTGVTLLVAAILFPLLPRVGSPYLVARATGMGQSSSSVGFSDEMSLESIGLIRTSREVAMRLVYETAPPPGHEMRYKGATYDIYEGRKWQRSPINANGVRLAGDGLYYPVDGTPRAWVHVWSEIRGARSLMLPVEAVAVELPGRRVMVDQGGAMLLPSPPNGTLNYRVGMDLTPTSGAVVANDWARSGAMDRSGVTEAMQDLAAETMGFGTARERTERLESWFVTEFGYTLDSMGAGGADPLERFLFRDRRGHCELFASSMVLMLRSQGIPARLATGFLGAEYNPLEEYFIVRQSNAHAWVEAWIEGEGWRIFDPTPPVGRPGGEERGLWSLVSQLYDTAVFRWDRYVLTFGIYDQLGMVHKLGELWDDLKARFRGEEAAPSIAGPEGGVAAPAEEGTSWRQRWMDPGLWAVIVLMMLAATWVAWRHRPAFTASRAYLSLRKRLADGEEPLTATAPLEMERRLAARFPEAAAPTHRLIELYLAESFGGAELGEEQLEELRAAMDSIRAAIRRAA